MTTLKLMGKKQGMTQRFDKKGNVVACTVIAAEPNVITQIKTKDNDGYDAVQTAFEKVEAKDPRRKEERTTKPLRGHFKKANVEARRYIKETPVETVENYAVGQEVTVAQFPEGSHVDVTGISKGKGFQGVIKLHGFRGGPAAHGSSFHRHAGSTGMRSTPGRCLPGGPRASHMGDDQVTVEGLEVIGVNAEKGFLIIKGSVPGPVGALVTVRVATKKTAKAKKK